MDIAHKTDIARRALASILTHDDAPIDQIAAAAAELIAEINSGLAEANGRRAATAAEAEAAAAGNA